jgi:hypothetical protein
MREDAAILNNRDQGLRIESDDAKITGRAKVIGNGSSGVDGGGIQTYSSALTIGGHATIAGNSGVLGGGIRAQGVLHLTGHASVVGNYAQIGGGISLTNGQLFIEHAATVTRNTATDHSGGVDSGGYLVSIWGKKAVTANTPDDCDACVL